MTHYTIKTAKGSSTGTLEEVLYWQAEYQGAMATVVTPDGEEIDISEMGIAVEDDPYREPSDMTPEEAAEEIVARLAST